MRNAATVASVPYSTDGTHVSRRTNIRLISEIGRESDIVLYILTRKLLVNAHITALKHIIKSTHIVIDFLAKNQRACPNMISAILRMALTRSQCQTGAFSNCRKCHQCTDRFCPGSVASLIIQKMANFWDTSVPSDGKGLIPLLLC